MIELRAAEAMAQGNKRVEYKFRMGREALPLILVPSDHLIYRLENYRTTDAQLSLIASGHRPSGFFSPTKREDPSAQQAQHDLLVQLAQEGSGETIKPIFDELARAKRQTEDLIITSDGVVVNGNRRLSAMRELLAEAREEYREFENVLCAVLPPSTTDEEILYLEIALQMQPETKLPYTWTVLGRAVRDLRALHKSDDEIASFMNRDKTEIQRAAKMIDAADLYLGEWLGKRNDYSLLDGTEQAFKQIATRNMAAKNDSALREITRQIDFFLIEQRKGGVQDRLYDLINVIEGNPQLFLQTLSAECEIEVPKKALEAAGGELEIEIPGSVSEESDFSVLVNEIKLARSDPDKAAATVASIDTVYQIVSEQSKRRDQAALEFSRKALKALRAITLQSANPSTYSEMTGVLAECISTCEKLQGDIAKRIQH